MDPVTVHTRDYSAQYVQYINYTGDVKNTHLIAILQEITI